jgi:glycolate dehydrogenase iron-sulfur subunit
VYFALNLHAPLSANHTNDDAAELQLDLSAELDRCVMCGMCSQHCPTYQLTADENESPRGRIALIAALVTGQLEVDKHLQAHLEHCTGCRACEAYCPSGVRFGAIMNAVRPLLPNTTTPAASSPPSAGWLRAYQRTGLQKLVRASGVLKPLGLAQKESLLPAIPATPAWRDYYPPSPTAETHGDVALFTGCIANTFDREALDASRRLLNALGYGVHVPPTQGCCGAMALHSGQRDEATTCAQTNLDAFATLDIHAIVHTASGCTAQLNEYPQLSDDPRAAGFSDRVKDINQFLAEAQWPDNLRPAPLPKTIALHAPCSLQNVLRQGDAPNHLLHRIPQLEIAPLPTSTRCCGGAGQYMLEQADFARQLREKTLNNFDSISTTESTQQQIDTLATSNLGCALHLAAGLRERGQNISVIHPVVLLARQLGLIK